MCMLELSDKISDLESKMKINSHIKFYNEAFSTLI